MSDKTREAIAEARKALSCLYIAVDKHVADDVNAKIESLILALTEREPVGLDALADLLLDRVSNLKPLASQSDWGWNTYMSGMRRATQLLRTLPASQLGEETP